MLVLRWITRQAEDAAKDPLTLHVNAIDLLVKFLTQYFTVSICSRRPGICKNGRLATRSRRISVELEEQKL